MGEPKYLVLSSTPLSRESAGLAVLGTFRVLTDDFEVQVDPHIPDDQVFVINREQFMRQVTVRFR